MELLSAHHLFCRINSNHNLLSNRITKTYTRNPIIKLEKNVECMLIFPNVQIKTLDTSLERVGLELWKFLWHPPIMAYFNICYHSDDMKRKTWQFSFKSKPPQPLLSILKMIKNEGIQFRRFLRSTRGPLFTLWNAHRAKNKVEANFENAFVYVIACC